jgi:gluconolactonase
MMYLIKNRADSDMKTKFCSIVALVMCCNFLGCSGGPSASGVKKPSDSSVAASSKMSSNISMPSSGSAIISSSSYSFFSSQHKSSSSNNKSVVSSSSSSVATSQCGVAPSGTLSAERIQSANSTRTEAGLYEGPVWINGALYFSDFTFAAGFPSRIQKLDANGTMTTFKNDSGSNGLAVDAQGNILAGTHKYKSISRFNLATGERTSVAEMYNNNVFNSPNDLVLANDGTVYFTDPDYQKSAAPGGQDKTHVFRVAANGDVTILDSTIYNPNGIALSPAGDVLYVSGGGDQGFLRAYAIVNGVVQEGINIVNDLKSPDGMAIDCYGNIYATEHAQKRVRVFTPAGDQMAVISVDANITNAAFGGAQGKTLYLTGAGAIWKLELDVTGSPY